jgi:hypothetical protein
MKTTSTFPSVTFFIYGSNLEEDEEERLDKAKHAAADEHHDEEGHAGHVHEDLLQPLDGVRVLW